MKSRTRSGRGVGGRQQDGLAAVALPVPPSDGERGVARGEAGLGSPKADTGDVETGAVKEVRCFDNAAVRVEVETEGEDDDVMEGDAERMESDEEDGNAAKDDEGGDEDDNDGEHESVSDNATDSAGDAITGMDSDGKDEDADDDDMDAQDVDDEDGGGDG